MKKIAGCDTKKSRLSLLCILYLLILIYATKDEFSAKLKLYEDFKWTNMTSDLPSRTHYIVYLCFQALILTLPLIYLVYKMCQYKCKWGNFILYLILILLAKSVLETITWKIYGMMYPTFYNSFNLFINMQNLEQQIIVLESSGMSKDEILQFMNANSPVYKFLFGMSEDEFLQFQNNYKTLNTN